MKKIFRNFAILFGATFCALTASTTALATDYIDKVPSTFQNGDTITFTKKNTSPWGTITLPKGQYRVYLRSSASGNSGSISSNLAMDSNWNYLQPINFPAIRGGYGVAYEFDKTFDKEVTFSFDVGPKGKNSNPPGLAAGSDTLSIHAPSGEGGYVGYLSFMGSENISNFVECGAPGGSSRHVQFSNILRQNTTRTYTQTQYGPYDRTAIHARTNLTIGRAIPQTSASDGLFKITVLNVNINNKPTISGSDQNLGEKDTGFSYDYSVDDIDVYDILSVQANIDSKQINKIDNAIRNSTYTVNLNDLWNSLSVGAHKLTIVVKDNYNAESTRIVTFTKKAPQNNPPTISGYDQNLGQKSDGFSYSYSVNDIDASDTITVTTKIDNNVIETINNAVRNQNYSVDVATSWNSILDGQHILTIIATDSQGASVIRTVTFTKKTVVTNHPPTISGIDTSWGEIDAPKTYTYFVSDPDVNDIVNVDIKIDGIIVDQQLNIDRTQIHMFDLASHWNSITGGQHTLTITATDSQGASVVRTITFSRKAQKVNNMPQISGSDIDWGQIKEPKSYSYVVNDIDQEDILSILTKIDGNEVSQVNNAIRWQLYTYDLQNDWNLLSNGYHVLTITVSDNQGGSVTRMISFNRINDGSIDPPDQTIVYKTKSGSKYHQEGCSSLSSSKTPITVAEAEAAGLTPCSKCCK